MSILWIFSNKKQLHVARASILATERERGERVSESEKRGNGGWRGQWRKEDG